MVNFNSIGPATTQNLAVKFDGEIGGGDLVENVSDDFPSKRSSKISFQTSPEVRHQFRQKLRQLHSGNRWCLIRKWVQQFYGRLEKCVLSARKTMSINSSFQGGGILGLGGGGVPILFLWARGFF